MKIKKLPSIYRIKVKFKPKGNEEFLVRGNDGYYYTWDLSALADHYEYEVIKDIDIFLLKSLVTRIFQLLLKSEGYEIRRDRLGNYDVFDPRNLILHESQDIFKILKGFEYRIRVYGDFLYLAVDYKIRFEPVASIGELIDKGVDPEFFFGNFVILNEDDKPKKCLVEKINEEEAEVRDLREELHRVSTREIYPEPKPHVLDEVLKLLGRKANAVMLQRKATFLDIRQASRRRLHEIRNIIDSLRTLFSKGYNGFEIELGSFIPVFDIETEDEQQFADFNILGSEGQFFYGGSVEESRLLFDREDPSQSHLQPAYGLKNFGPFSKGDISTIKISIISPSNKEDKMKDLFRLLSFGNQRTFFGFRETFRSSLELKHIIKVRDETIDAYRDACEKFVSIDNGETDVVLVYVPKTDRSLPYSPYYVVKHSLLQEGYPSQMVTENTFKNLDFSLLNLASAIYAKSGGTPWVLEKNLKNIDMIIGVSYSQLLPERAYHLRRSFERYIGFVNIFDNWGKWMFFQANVYPYSKDDLSSSFQDLVRTAIRRFEHEKRYKPTKMVFHYSKRFGKDERQAIIKVCEKELTDVNIAFISINDDHPFRVFDLSTIDGSFPRGSYVFLNKNEYLLSTTGISLEKITRQGIGTPRLLHINVHQYPKTFLKPKEIIDHIFAMTRLNWATATPLIREPVTISFSRMAAYMIASSTVSQWGKTFKSIVMKRLEGKAWFI